MKRQPILEENRSYTFSNDFKLPYPTRDIVAEFGYQFKFEKLELPYQKIDRLNLDRLQTTFYKKLPHISLNSEATKREFWISPVLLELLDYVEIDIDTEYPLTVSDQLKGNIDYIIQAKTDFIVIEAKNADLDKGFTQLAVELIAIDRYLDTNDDRSLYGAVTMGNVWQFGVLDRDEKTISKNIDALLVPADLEALFSVLVGILDPR